MFWSKVYEIKVTIKSNHLFSVAFSAYSALIGVFARPFPRPTWCPSTVKALRRRRESLPVVRLSTFFYKRGRSNYSCCMRRYPSFTTGRLSIPRTMSFYIVVVVQIRVKESLDYSQNPSIIKYVLFNFDVECLLLRILR
jgi:hypothetical protein